MKDRAMIFWIIGISLGWLALGLVLFYGFAPVDFYGEGAWYAQGVIRWERFGWPTIPIAGPFVAERGLGAFTLWIYFSLLRLSFALGGPDLGSMIRVSLVTTSGALLFTGFLMRKIDPRTGFWTLFLFILFALSPLLLAFSHTPRPIGLMQLWITGCSALILSERPWSRRLGFFLVPFSFWIHQLGAIMALGLFVATTVAFLAKRRYGGELLSIIIGGAIVLGLSLIVPLIAGKFALMEEVVIHYNKSAGPRNLLSAMYIPLAMAILGTGFLILPLRKARIGVEKGLVVLITVGLVLIPMILGMRPRRTFQFVYPLVWILLYIGFLYAAQLGRVFKYGFLALVIAGVCFYWWRSRDIISITIKNPHYIRTAKGFVARNQARLASADSVLMAFHGEGYLFWLLPKEKQLTASPYFRGPVREGNLVLITDYELRGIPYLVPLDSLDLGFTYSFYGARPFRRIYLCRGIGGN
ncbi:MAG: hypothetical protein ABIM74_09110 [candidate division WOR-3 bacterium]